MWEYLCTVKKTVLPEKIAHDLKDKQTNKQHTTTTTQKHTRKQDGGCEQSPKYRSSVFIHQMHLRQQAGIWMSWRWTWCTVWMGLSSFTTSLAREVRLSPMARNLLQFPLPLGHREEKFSEIKNHLTRLFFSGGFYHLLKSRMWPNFRSDTT